MQIHPQLNDIDDCLYRVVTKAIITYTDKVLLVQETSELWWGFPGGGIDHGETAELALSRELEEELGVPAKAVTVDTTITHYTIGTIVHGIPRMNLFFRVSLPKELITATDQVVGWGWFTKDEFLAANMSASYATRQELAQIVFGS
jgi:8-oxo-dGTP pyrophosphatase MutT (NUDIX family)